MMVSTTHSCKKLHHKLLRCIGIFFICTFLFHAINAKADEATVSHVEILPEEKQYVVNANIEFELNQRLNEALLHGIALHFVAEFVVESPRWYWFDLNISKSTINYRLSYIPITKSYRLSIGGIHRNFESLEEAVAILKNIKSWSVLEKNQLKPDESYNVAFRWRLDTSLLPRPFQVTSAIGSRDWQLATEWSRWQFRPQNQ